MNQTPMIITRTEQGFYLVPPYLPPHGAFLIGRGDCTRHFDRHLPKGTHVHHVPLNSAYWHQRN